MRVWSLSACAERADYKHNADVTAGCRFGDKDCVLCDENGAIVRIAVRGSAMRAEELGIVPFRVGACRQIASNLLALIDEAEGAIHIFDTDLLCLVNTIGDRRYTTLRLSEPPLKRLLPVVVAGTRDGHAVFMELHLSQQHQQLQQQ